MTALLLLLASVPAAPGIRSLAFEFRDTGIVLACYPISGTGTFRITYTHSIHLTPVDEYYAVRQATIVQERIAYGSYGVGMPANAEGDERFDMVDGRYVVSGMSRTFRQVDMRVARVTASQTVSIDGRRTAFTAFAEPGDWIRMRVRTVPACPVKEGGELDG